MEPVALAGDALLCHDGSLVSLVRIEGARSITGTKELGGFVELAKRRLNGSFLDRGHGLHIVLERAPDAARAAIRRGRPSGSAVSASVWVFLLGM